MGRQLQGLVLCGSGMSAERQRWQRIMRGLAAFSIVWNMAEAGVGLAFGALQGQVRWACPRQHQDSPLLDCASQFSLINDTFVYLVDCLGRIRHPESGGNYQRRVGLLAVFGAGCRETGGSSSSSRNSPGTARDARLASGRFVPPLAQSSTSTLVSNR